MAQHFITLRISEGGLALGKRAWPSLRSRPTATSRPKCSAALNAPTAAPLPCYAMLVCSSRTFQFAARPQNRMLCPRRGSPSQQRLALLHSAAVLSAGMSTSCGVMRHQPHCSPEPQNVMRHFLNPARVFAHPPLGERWRRKVRGWQCGKGGQRRIFHRGFRAGRVIR